MNGQARDLLSLKVALLCGAAMALSACASVSAKLPIGETAVNPASPAAGEVTAILAKPGAFPTFAGIPEIPKDLPQDQTFKTQVESDEAAAAETTASTAPETWYLDASDAFAARATADAGAGGVRAPTDAEIAESEAFARATRDRAKPPPRPR